MLGSSTHFFSDVNNASGFSIGVLLNDLSELKSFLRSALYQLKVYFFYLTPFFLILLFLYWRKYLKPKVTLSILVLVVVSTFMSALLNSFNNSAQFLGIPLSAAFFGLLVHFADNRKIKPVWAAVYGLAFLISIWVLVNTNNKSYNRFPDQDSLSAVAGKCQKVC